MELCVRERSDDENNHSNEFDTQKARCISYDKSRSK